MKRTNQMEQAKQEYERIEIPKELSQRVEKAIRQCGQNRGKVVLLQKRKAMFQKGAACAAAAVLVFVVSVNTSTAFAKTIDGVPVLGSLARIITFRSYENEKEDIKLSVEIPSVEMIAETNNGLADAVNQEIYELCEQYAQESMARAEEYRQAFLDTGGTKDEWAAHNLGITIGYEIKSQTDRYLSFAILGNESWSSAFDIVRYYTMDLESQSIVTLRDILGEDYINIANRSIQTQIKEKEIQGMSFFKEEDGGFKSITQDSHFYLNEKGNPVIVFDKYEIAAGAYGMVEFEIINSADGYDELTDDTKTSNASEEQRQYYEDNFAVDKEAVAVFAGRIKQVVEERDLEGLADMACYPLYVGSKQGGSSVKNRDEFIALGSDTVFTSELVEAIKEADGKDLPPSRAGFILAGDGTSNIIFGVTDGKLGIKGINY